MNIDDIKKIAVLGAGAMGHGIAQVFARWGYRVSLYDISPESLGKGMGKISDSLNHLAGKGKISPGGTEEIMGRISPIAEVKEAVYDAGLIIEAVPEIMELKKNLFAKISEYARPDAILTTNTSTMSINEMSAAVKNRQRFAGMHFFNPPGIMKLVEVIYCGGTSHETISILSALTEKIGKVPVKVFKDRPGFIVNRVNSPTRPLLWAILEEGIIKPGSIDTAMKKDGVKMGPYELMDFVGLDIVYSGMKYYETNLSPEWKPGKVLTGLIEKNFLGMKSGRGIYAWRSGKAVIDASSDTREISSIHFDAVRLNEALKILKEGVAGSAADIDLAMTAGLNIPMGPFMAAKNHEPNKIAAALKMLSERYGLSILMPVPEIADGSYRGMK